MSSWCLFHSQGKCGAVQNHFIGCQAFKTPRCNSWRFHWSPGPVWANMTLESVLTEEEDREKDKAERPGRRLDPWITNPGSCPRRRPSCLWSSPRLPACRRFPPWLWQTPPRLGTSTHTQTQGQIWQGEVSVCECVSFSIHRVIHPSSPPLLAASTASVGRPNWFMRGPSWPDAKALLNMLIAWVGRGGVVRVSSWE